MRGLPRTRVSLPATYPRKRGPRAWHTGVRQTAQRLATGEGLAQGQHSVTSRWRAERVCAPRLGRVRDADEPLNVAG